VEAVSGMGRPERPLDPLAGPVPRFAAELRKLRTEAGRPAYWKMARRCDASKSALAGAAAGRQLPSWRTVSAFVQACGQAADLPRWRARWDRAATDARAAAEADPGEAGMGEAGWGEAGWGEAGRGEDGADRPAGGPGEDDTVDVPALLPVRRPAAGRPRPAVRSGPPAVIEAEVVRDRARRLRRPVRLVLAVVAVLTLLAGTALVVRLARRPSPAPAAGPARPAPAASTSLPSIPPLISATGRAPVAASCGTAADRLPCQGRNPYDTGCGADAVEAVTANLTPVRIRVEYSPTCQAAWAVLTAPPGFQTRLELSTAAGFRTCFPAGCAGTGPIDATGCRFLPAAAACMWTDMAHLTASVGAAATAVAVWRDPAGHLSRRFVSLTGDDVPVA
jgi:hypothetical protein